MSFTDIRMSEGDRRDFRSPFHKRIILCSNIAVLIAALDHLTLVGLVMGPKDRSPRRRRTVAPPETEETLQTPLPVEHSAVPEELCSPWRCKSRSRR